MLAGFSFALIGLVLTSPQSLHWPSLTLALLVGAGLLLSVAVQFGSIARRWAIPPADWRELLSIAPDETLRAMANGGPAALDKHRRWLLWTRVSFNLGLVVLFIAVAFALVPARPHMDLTGGRILAIVFAGIGAVGQAITTVVMGTRAALWNRSVRARD